MNPFKSIKIKRDLVTYLRDHTSYTIKSTGTTYYTEDDKLIEYIQDNFYDIARIEHVRGKMYSVVVN